MAPCYEYQPLTTSEQEIRLLTITNKTSMIHGQITRVSLNEQPAYTALSYTWKKPFDDYSDESTNPETHIEVSGKILRISTILEEALECLYRCKIGSVWIDAICIDQDNQDERSEQISLMGILYSKAQKVIVWLGPETNSSGAAWDFLRLMAERTDDPYRTQWLESMARDRANLYLWKALKGVLKRSWWRRVWVIQEYVLAANTTFACGNQLFPGDQFEAAFDVLCDGWARAFATGNMLFNGRQLDPISNMLDLRRIRKSGERVGPLTYLWKSRESLASDSRDYLFAKLGLLDDEISTLCKPTYYQPPLVICREFAKAYILTKGDLSIICFAGMSPRNNGQASWVPNWGYSRPAYPLLCSTGGSPSDWPSYNAARGTRPIVEFPAEVVLRCTCIFLDEVDGVQFDPWCHDPPESKSGVQSQSHNCAYASEEGMFEALFRTTVADTNRWACLSRAPVEFGLLFAQKCQELNYLLNGMEGGSEELPSKPRPGATNIEKRWHGMRNLKLGGVSLQDLVDRNAGCNSNEKPSGESASLQPISTHPMWRAYEHSIGQTMYHRRLFTTQHGYLGIGSRTLGHGDRICVLLGCPVPVILRPRGSRYELIGDCYVHGIMDGECLSEARLNDGRSRFGKVEII